MKKRHWTEMYSCQCGKHFKSYAAEAIHRHNFPMMCKMKIKVIKKDNINEEATVKAQD